MTAAAGSDSDSDDDEDLDLFGEMTEEEKEAKAKKDEVRACYIMCIPLLVKCLSGIHTSAWQCQASRH